MDRISLYEKKETGFTKVSDCFIDHFMTDANEAQIKIYLYLLRSVSSGCDISVPDIADRFNYTERDILRALIYWDRRGLITLDFDTNKNVRGICLNNVQKPLPQGSVYSVSGMDPALYSGESSTAAYNAPAEIPAEKPQAPLSPARPFYSADQIKSFKGNEEVRGLLFTAEQYLSRTLSSSDIGSILYMHDSLQFSTDLIEFLVESCVSNGHKNMHYIESVALDWNERGIKSVKSAKLDIERRKDYYDVLKAFGLSGRDPVKSEVDYIRRWRDEYGFSSELIIEAANRTMSSISKPSFRYADSILRHWQSKKISDMAALKEEDRLHESFKAEKPERNERKDNSRPVGRIHNFRERDYDFQELERKFARN